MSHANKKTTHKPKHIKEHEHHSLNVAEAKARNAHDNKFKNDIKKTPQAAEKCILDSNCIYSHILLCLWMNKNNEELMQMFSRDCSVSSTVWSLLPPFPFNKRLLKVLLQPTLHAKSCFTLTAANLAVSGRSVPSGHEFCHSRQILQPPVYVRHRGHKLTNPTMPKALLMNINQGVWRSTLTSSRFAETQTLN